MKSKSVHVSVWFVKDAVGTPLCLLMRLLPEGWLETRHVLLQGERRRPSGAVSTEVFGLR